MKVGTHGLRLPSPKNHSNALQTLHQQWDSHVAQRVLMKSEDRQRPPALLRGIYEQPYLSKRRLMTASNPLRQQSHKETAPVGKIMQINSDSPIAIKRQPLYENS
jgi:hypothetical protein